MKKYLSILFFAISIIASNSYSQQAAKIDSKSRIIITEDIIIEQLRFESEESLVNWTAQKGEISISNHHFKDGQHALKWDWKKGDALVLSNMPALETAGGTYQGGIPEYYEPAYYPQGMYGGIKMWVYQENPQQGQLIGHIGSSATTAETNPKYRFTLDLNFKGWKAVWVAFEEDAKVANYKGSEPMSSMVLFPSKNLKGTGSLFIDHFTLLEFVSKKRHSDIHIQNNKDDAGRSDSYKILEPYQQFLNENYPSKANNKEALIKDNQLISDRLEFLILGDGSEKWKQRQTGIETKMEAVISTAKKQYKKLNIKRQDGHITGVPLFSSRDEHATPEGQYFQYTAQNTLFPLAIDSKVNNNKESFNQLMDVLEHLEDQGWRAGSAFGTVDHVIRLNTVAQPVFMIRDELKSKGSLGAYTGMLVWHSRLGSILDIDTSIAENTDKVRGGALVKLIAILLMENSSQKETLLSAFKSYMDYVIGFAPGYGDTVKPDYSIYHHRGTYLNSYGIQSINTMAMIHWLLDGTNFALSETSSEILKNTLYTQSSIAFGNDLHYGVCGRFPEHNQAINRFLLPAYAFMSMTGTTISDKELAAHYNYLYNISQPEAMVSILMPSLSYSGSFGTLDLMVDLHQKMNNELKTPNEGHFTLPYSSLSVHRTKGAYAAVKGYNRYIWDFESGQSKGENMLGRYLSFGTLIVAQNNSKDGFKGSGMDYNNGFHTAYLPGATTKALPAEKMLYNQKATSKYLEGFHRSFSQSTFAGGLTQEGINGMYAMELRDDVDDDADKALFDESFRAKKSYFLIGDEIICLGSNIQNTDSRFNTITTLFQHQWKTDKPVFYNGTAIGNEQGLHQSYANGVISDGNGIHYIMGEGSDIILEQGPQKALKRTGRTHAIITTVHTKAYINHGKAPENAGYEYQILVNTPLDDVENFNQNRSYEVLIKNTDVHHIFHRPTSTSAYAIFSAEANLKDGPLVKTDTPILAMFKETNKHATLTIADPDLRLPVWNHNMSRMPEQIVNGRSSGHIATITLKGKWFVAKEVFEVQSIHQEGNTTILKVYCKDGKSVDIPLINKNTNS